MSWGGKEEILRDYEVLTGDKSYFHWVERSGTCNPQSFTPLKGGHEAVSSISYSFGLFLFKNFSLLIL
ncbi:hypothetical protein RhiirC2_741348 [Rhizophagus irregularis]|uniref:Uncharacterized protein n=1 Tax=Rhizophagus irregularis TaxID=588596 RepID=A0A2N1NGY5_9GLOM|nr:hypothetical protein RhiirC2_741348 [Rhizophagus irregularis]